MPFLKNVNNIKPSYGVLRLSRKPICVAIVCLNIRNICRWRAGPGNLGSTDGLTAQAREISRAPGVHAVCRFHKRRIILGFTYKHADDNLTRIAGQLFVRAPFENKSESMTQQQRKFAGLWCVVRQAQMQSWFWRHFRFHVLLSRFPISSYNAKLISK
jgi:hypothetical protein